MIQEATAVSPEGRIYRGDLGLWKDEHITKMQAINQFILFHLTISGIQLACAGRKTSVSEPWNGNKKLDETNGG